MLPDTQRPRVTVPLDPGDYRLISWQRPCVGTCAELDPPRDRCELGFRVRRGDALAATVQVRPGEGCSIDLDGE